METSNSSTYHKRNVAVDVDRDEDDDFANASDHCANNQTLLPIEII